MNTRTHVKLRPQFQLPSQRHAVWISVILSVLLHTAVIAALVMAPIPSGGHRLAPGAVSVRLVSLPGPPASGSPSPAPRTLPEPITTQPESVEKLPTVPLPEPVPEPVAAPEPVEIEEAPKVVSLAPKPKPSKPKTSLKKKTKDPDKIIKGAIDRIKKGVNPPKKQPSSVNAALERIKKQVAESEARRLEPYQPQSSGSAGSGSGSAGGGGGGAITLVDIYRGEVATRIQKNWAFSKQLGGNTTGLEAKIEFKVLPGGEITDIEFNTRSNNAYFDDSAYKAIVKSNPVAPHPRGVSKSYIMVGLRFTPEGIR
jgi:colicin import membrane protein